MKREFVPLLAATFLLAGCERHSHADHSHDHDHDHAQEHVHDEADHDDGAVAVIDAAAAQAAGVAVAIAGPREIHDVLPLHGRLVISPDATRSVGARFPGIVRSVQRNVGDAVRAGDVLARIESNESLREYALTAPIAGVVTRRDAQPGQDSGTQPLFTISDPSQVWAELSVFPRDLPQLETGQAVRLRGVDDARSTRGAIVRIAPAGIDARQALTAWARLDDADGWIPGLYVQADVSKPGATAAVAVAATALQTLDGASVVFVRDGDRYTPQRVATGRRDSEYVEILSGLDTGATYVSANSFLIKAELEKDGAGHDH